MSASPAQWTARLILAAALGAGVFYVVAAPSARRDPASSQTPLASRTAQPSKPRDRPGAPYPIPDEVNPALTAPVRTSPAPTQPDEAYRIKRVLDTGGPIRYGKWFWDEAGAPADGQVVITVDLKANVLSIFRGGYEIGTAAVIYGADEVPTPLGVYPIIGKDADHISNLYNAPMPYMLRLTNDGISIHGSKVAYDAATHGCIGVPTPFAKKLFAAARLGDKVIITRGEQLAQGEAVTAAAK